MAKIVIFNGPPRSGKDTAADLLYQHANMRYGPYRYRFASPLKLAVHEIFGFTHVHEEYFSQSKDIENESMYGMTPRNAYIWMSEEVIKPRFGQDFFARVAVNSIRRMLHRLTLNRIIDPCDDDTPIVVISDCGFQSEIDVMVNEFGKENVALVYLLREGTSFYGDSRGYVQHDPAYSFVLNNNGTKDELLADMVEILRGFLYGK